MALRTAELLVTDLQWLKIQLRLTALEQSGPRLNYRFEFHRDPSVDVTCDIYYIDSESNSMKKISQDERIEIYEGRVALGMDIIRRAIALAELPRSFVWTPTLQFVLHEDCGMGGLIVHTIKSSFTWPESSDK